MKSTLLHLFDVGSPSRMTQKEKQDTLRLLQKYLTAEVRRESGVIIPPIIFSIQLIITTTFLVSADDGCNYKIP